MKGGRQLGDRRRSLRDEIYFYLIDAKTIPGKIIDVFIITLNVVVCLLFVVETYPVSDEIRTFLWNVEVVTVCFFIVEYCARLYASKHRLKHLLNVYSIIDLLAIVPTLTILVLPAASSAIGVVRILRVFKVFRIFRFLRFTHDPDFFFGKITLHMLKVMRLVLTILIIFFVSSGLFWFIENEVNQSVDTFGDSFYFTVVALTTVGFGDITPISEGGRWVTVFMIISGIILIPWQAGQIVREWIYISDKKPIVCSHCGLKYHDQDASHCKACGNIIYQEFAGH